MRGPLHRHFIHTNQIASVFGTAHLSDKFVAVNVWCGSQMAKLRPQPACWYHRNRSHGPFPGTCETVSHDMAMDQSLGAHEPALPQLYFI
jgi:hypothetical protein